MGYFIIFLITFGAVISLILIVETFVMFNNIKDIKDLLTEQINIQNQINIRIEDMRRSIKN